VRLFLKKTAISDSSAPLLNSRHGEPDDISQPVPGGDPVYLI
jgi:hypothetical protein